MRRAFTSGHSSSVIEYMAVLRTPLVGRVRVVAQHSFERGPNALDVVS
jgi:hypothetical protein